MWQHQLQMKILETEKAIFEMPWNRSDFYQLYLKQTYFYVSHSTKLLALMMGHIPPEQNQIAQRIIHHLSEENHHEKLASNDVKNLKEKISESDELLSTKNFYQINYYHIQHLHPLSFFGYIIFLEVLAAQIGPKLLIELKKHYPEKCLTFLKVHSEEDPSHVEKAYAQINSFPPEIQTHIWNSILQSQFNFVALLHDIKAQCDKIHHNQAA